MKIRHRLTLLFTVITAILMIVFGGFIYLNAAENREDEFYKRLRQLASTKANLLLDAKVDAETLQLIYKNTRDALFQEEVAIYDTSFNLLYHDAVEIDFVKETPEMIRQIIREKQIEFYQNDWQVTGFLFQHNNRDYVITAAAYDEYGFSKLNYLKIIILISLTGGIVILFVAGYIFSKHALNPVSEIVDKVDDITATNLDLRLNEGNGQDELAELAITFNKMLDRLESSFAAQKEFVSNISHEIRTPLAAIIAELEIAKSRNRTPEAYQQAIELALNDAKRLSRLSSGLLDLAKAGYDQANIRFQELRIDELLLQAKIELIKANPSYKINLHFDSEFDEDINLLVKGNEYLLKTAFLNLMENGCKFSENNQVNVVISSAKGKILVRFKDRGTGIASQDMPNLFKPFYRGQNKGSAEGYGIGLSLTQKIINIHKGKIHVDSVPGEGTEFEVEIPVF